MRFCPPLPSGEGGGVRGNKNTGKDLVNSHHPNRLSKNLKLTALSIMLCSLTFSLAAADDTLEFQVEEKPATINVPRLGINLGEWTSWGASQYPINVLKNPGFEGIIDRAIVIVKSADERSFLDDTAWTKRPDGFWAGAQFEIRSGLQAGTQGILFDSVASGRQGLPEFIVRGQAPVLAQGDVVSLTLINDKTLPTSLVVFKRPITRTIECRQS